MPPSITRRCSSPLSITAANVQRRPRWTSSAVSVAAHCRRARAAPHLPPRYRRRHTRALSPHVVRRGARAIGLTPLPPPNPARPPPRGRQGGRGGRAGARFRWRTTMIFNIGRLPSLPAEFTSGGSLQEEGAGASGIIEVLLKLFTYFTEKFHINH
jgi:hypothetical protein